MKQMKRMLLSAATAMMLFSVCAVPCSAAGSGGGTVTSGDVNNDGSIDAADVTMLAEFLLSGDGISARRAAAADMNGDSKLNAADLTLLKRQLLTAGSGQGESDGNAGASGITVLTADGSNTTLTSGSVTVTIGGKSVTLSGAYVVDGIEATLIGGTYSTDVSDQTVFLVVNGGSLTVSNAVISKSGDALNSDSSRTSDVSDDYNFYGYNSVIVCVGSGSTATINDCEISAVSTGSNAVFATAGAQIDIDNCEIETTASSSRGVYGTYEGVVNASHMTITTAKAHCAPIATDRGGGYITVTDTIVSASGSGSPCIYSTGQVICTNVIGTAKKSQAIVIEGKNSVTLYDCELTTVSNNNGVMMYQSGSGDAADSDATATYSTLNMTNSAIINQSSTPMFYITNTHAAISLLGGNTMTGAAQLVSAAAGNWGKDGSNGGRLVMNITDESYSGSIIADDISWVELNLNGSAAYTGTTSGSVTITE